MKLFIIVLSATLFAFLAVPKKDSHKAELAQLAKTTEEVESLSRHISSLRAKRSVLHKKLGLITDKNFQEKKSTYVLQEVEELDREIIERTKQMIVKLRDVSHES